MTTTTTAVRPLDPAAEGALVEELHAQLVAATSIDLPHEPPTTLRSLRVQLLAGFWGERVRVLVAGEPGRLLGAALVALPVHDNLQTALVELHVALPHRRQGVGAALWAAALDAVRAEGRTSVLVEAREGSPLAAFLAGVGARPQLREVQRVLDLGRLDRARVAALHEAAARAAAAYRLEVWAGPTPPELRAPLAVATAALNDAPRGELDLEDEVFDGERVAQRDAAVAAAGLRLHGALALTPQGQPAGFTDITVSEDGTYAWQWGTGVVAAERGARLGTLLKTTVLERLSVLEPDLRQVTTWNAEDNAHMVAVNEALGFRRVAAWDEWQLTVA